MNTLELSPDQALTSGDQASIPHKEMLSLDEVLNYRFDPLVHRMVDKYGWEEIDALACFEDTKRFLFLAATSLKSVIPSPRIDEMWHNWILFTEDYANFCRTSFGRFLHHNPRRRDDPVFTDGYSVKETLQLAERTFGDLSQNWEFPANKTASCSCSSWCQCS